MILELKFKYHPEEFDDEGFSLMNDSSIFDLFHEWENDFHEAYFPFVANCLFANYPSMMIIEKGLECKPDERCGMELINGKVDIDANMEMMSFSEYTTVFALASELENHKEEPIYLVIDDNLRNDTIILKYISDVDDDDDDGDILIEDGPVDLKKILFV